MKKKIQCTCRRFLSAALGAALLCGCGAASDTSAPADAGCEAPADDGGSYAPALEEAYHPEYNTEEYSAITDNRFLSVRDHPLSTFAADVDTASYANMRRYVNSGELPPADAIRVEELINYFHYDYPLLEENEPFSCTTEVVQCPWNEDTLLMRIGIATEPIHTEELPPQNLVFLIDVSGSMEGPDRLDLVKRAFLLLCEQLRSEDTISIITYASSDQVLLQGAGSESRDMIMYAIESLSAGGSTNGSAGIETAYRIAEKYKTEDSNNRIILATDGDLNLGITSESDLKRLVESEDFADDTKDGGELGAGHQVTVLYELVPLDSPMEIESTELRYQEQPESSGSEEFCTVSIRCKEPDSNTSTQYDYPVGAAVSDEMSPSTALASAVAQAGMLLRDSPYSGNADYASVLDQLEQLEESIRSPYTDEFVELVMRMKRLDRMGDDQ